MEILRSPFALALYVAAAGLTVWGTGRKRNHALSFLGGSCWAAGTVSALVEGAALHEVLAVTLALLLVSTGFWRGARR